MKRIALVDKDRCVACGVCAKTCPRAAVTIRRGCYAQVETEKCVGCGLCARACPAGCIGVKERSGTK